MTVPFVVLKLRSSPHWFNCIGHLSKGRSPLDNWHNFWNFKLSPRMKSPHLIGVPPRSQKKKMSQGVRRAIAIATPYRKKYQSAITEFEELAKE
ncbi:hypothetical protein [Nostoc sp.]|uniref:hypothetical protein n=1 Tax=Nostoc sp. TaxID=1180 RepID=UPI0035937B5A